MIYCYKIAHLIFTCETDKMKKIYLAAVSGNLGMLSVGQFLGWASPALTILMLGKDPEYSVRLTSEEASWVASFLMLGGSVGAIINMFVVNVIGRKNAMLFAAVPAIISWLMIAFATSSWELYVSRLMCGLGTGIAYSATPIYLGEISPPDIRGNLGSMLTVAVKVGMLIEYAIGPFLSVRNLALISLAGPCLFVITFIWLPESPYHLMRRDAKQKAINSLVQLRGKEDVYKEADDIERSVKLDLANETGFREILFVSSNRRTLTILLCLVLLQQLSGVIMLQYTEMIFDQMNNKLEGKYLTIIIGVVQLISTIVCMFTIDRYGRKMLLMISAIGSACSNAMVAAYFNLQYNHMDTSEVTWLPVVGVIMFIVMYCLGLASMPFTLCSELFPTNVKALSTTIVIIGNNLFAFIMIKSYMSIANLGMHVPFWIFTACNLVSALFTLVCVPETKGKTLEQIQKKLHKSSKQ